MDTKRRAMKLWPFLLAVGCGAIGIGGSKFIDYMAEPEPPPSAEAQLLIDSLDDGHGWQKRSYYGDWVTSSKVGLHVSVDSGHVYIGADPMLCQHCKSDRVPLSRSDRRHIRIAVERNIEKIGIRPFVDRLVKSAKEDLAKKEAEANKK